jgi:cytochrome c biogenesis protein CcdA
VKWVLVTVAGVVLVVGGAGLWWKRRALGGTPAPAADATGGGGSALAMGAGIAAVEFFTAFPYFAAIAMVVGSSVGAPGKVALIVLYNVVYVLPLIVIVVMCALMGERAGRTLAPVGDWISLHWPEIVAPLAEIAGIALAAYGVTHLT